MADVGPILRPRPFKAFKLGLKGGGPGLQEKLQFHVY